MAILDRTTSTRGVCGCGRRFNRGSGFSACAVCRSQHGAASINNTDPRAAAMAERYRGGLNLHDVAREFGLSAERVRQILNAYGVSRTDGGRGIRARKAAARSADALDKRYREKYGHSRADHARLLALGRAEVAAGGSWAKTPIRAFMSQRNSASFRGIEWRLTLAEWWRVWVESGKWAHRGRGHGSYAMSRCGDVGPYAVGNVFIQLADLNNSTGPQKKSDLPIGVIRSTWKSGTYCAQTMLGGKVRYLGSFRSVEEASRAYQNAQPKVAV